MRPSPPAAVAVALAAALIPGLAAAQSCSEEMVSSSALKVACGNPKDKAGCRDYLDAILRNCEKDVNAAADGIVEIKKKPKPLSAQDLKKIEDYKSEFRQITYHQLDLTHNLLAGAYHEPGETSELPALDLDHYQKDVDAYLKKEGITAHKTEQTPLGLDTPMPSELNPPGSGAAPGILAGVTAGGMLNLGAAAESGLEAAVANLMEKTPGSTPAGTIRRKASAGEAYIAAGDAKDARRVGAELVKLAPKDAEGPALLARAALSDDKPAEAADWARKALALDPANKEARNALSFAEASLSKSRLKRPGLKPGFEDAEGAVVAGGGQAPSPRDGAGGPPGGAGGGAGRSPVVEEILPTPPHLQLAERTAAAGDLPGALGYLTLALDQNPEDDYARVMRSEISLALKNPDSALADADRVLAKKPDDPRALRAKASALLQLGRLEEALAVIERAIALAPLNAAGHLTRAMILEKLGRAADAAAAYREAARLDPALKPVADEALRRLGFAESGGAGLSALRGKLTRGAMVALSGALLLAVLLGTARRRGDKTSPPPAASRSTSSRAVGTGDLVGGQYRVARELGRGGMGVVFEAVDETLKRSVALKQMNAELLTAEDAARFLQEARLVAQLKHPGIAGILAAVEDGGLYLVFELMEGRSLDKVLSETGPLPPADVRRVIGDLCEALSCAHQSRIIHRDLKPSNVMFTKDRRSKIMDFGIAHQSRGAAATQTSASGTPPYMAPEQAMGSVLPASDLYALAVMAYELLAGARPFRGPDYLGPKMRGEFDAITKLRPGLPASLDAFFARALAPDPAKRPQDAAGFRRAFDACWDDGLAKTLV